MCTQRLRRGVNPRPGATSLVAASRRVAAIYAAASVNGREAAGYGAGRCLGADLGGVGAGADFCSGYLSWVQVRVLRAASLRV